MVQHSESCFSAPPKPLFVLVEHDAFIQSEAADMMARSGCETIIFSDSADALHMAPGFDPVAILIDSSIPGMGGYALCRAMRLRPEFESVVIIILADRNEAGAVDLAVSAGASDCVTKPVDWQMLERRIEVATRAQSMETRAAPASGYGNFTVRLAKLGYWSATLTQGSLEMSPELRNMLSLPQDGRLFALDDLPQFIHPADRAWAAQELRQSISSGQPFARGHRMVGRDGREFMVHHCAASDSAEPERKIVGVVEDVTDHGGHGSARNRDVTTGMLNRRGLRELVNQVLDRHRNIGDKPVLLLVGVDRFTLVRGGVGSATADQLLQAVAERLGYLERDGHTVARFSADVLAILFEGVCNEGQADRLVQEAMERARRPQVGGTGLGVLTPANGGAAVAPMDGTDADSLFQAARKALNSARLAGEGCYYFHHMSMREHMGQRVLMEHDLPFALERAQLRLLYQPQICTRTRAIVGMEALLRWVHPTLGMIAPDRFIPAAERAGLMPAMGAWVLEAACRQTMSWQQRGLGALRVGVNLSGTQLVRGDLVDQVQGILERTGMAPSQVELEITENIATFVRRRYRDTISSLRRLGVQTSIDDFGTGYSSLSALHDLPVDTVKIDRFFIKNIGQRMHGATLASGIISLARSLNFKVVAEGVESMDQFEYLRNKGCNEVQGYLFGRPMEAAQFARLVHHVNHDGAPIIATRT